MSKPIETQKKVPKIIHNRLLRNDSNICRSVNTAEKFCSPTKLVESASNKLKYAVRIVGTTRNQINNSAAGPTKIKGWITLRTLS